MFAMGLVIPCLLASIIAIVASNRWSPHGCFVGSDLRMSVLFAALKALSAF
jgi:hypothetical protein